MNGITTPPATPRAPYNPAQAPLAPVRPTLVARPVVNAAEFAAGGVNAFFQAQAAAIGFIPPLGPQ